VKRKLSEAITPSHPVTPILDGLGRVIISGYRLKLRKGNGQAFALPADGSEHFMITFVCGTHPQHFNLTTNLKGRYGPLRCASGGEWRYSIIEIIVPTQGTFLFVMGVDNGIHQNALLACVISFRFRHGITVGVEEGDSSGHAISFPRRASPRQAEQR